MKRFGNKFLALTAGCMTFLGLLGGSASAAITENELAGTVTYGVESYAELIEVLGRVNPGTGQQHADKAIVIELQNDLDIVADVDTAALKGVDQAVTGATLKIARGEMTIDGKNKKIDAHGYPTFHVTGSREESSALTDILIQNLTIHEAGYQK